jgi:hypothetical protein
MVKFDSDRSPVEETLKQLLIFNQNLLKNRKTTRGILEVAVVEGEDGNLYVDQFVASKNGMRFELLKAMMTSFSQLLLLPETVEKELGVKSGEVANELYASCLFTLAKIFAENKLSEEEFNNLSAPTRHSLVEYACEMQNIRFEDEEDSESKD